MKTPYIIGRETLDGGTLYYAEGFCVAPQWTRRYNANQYSNKRDALREAKKVGGFVTTYARVLGRPDVRIA
jgi:hypothetical protein